MSRTLNRVPAVRIRQSPPEKNEPTKTLVGSRVRALLEFERELPRYEPHSCFASSLRRVQRSGGGQGRMRHVPRC